MLIINLDMDAGLVNGSRGVITGFEPVRGFPYVKFKKGGPRLIEPFIWWSHEFPHIGQQQIPLRVAYAITIHKSQGASIDSAIVDIGKNTFEYGQAYVALSRVRSLEGLHIFALDVSRIRTHPRVLAFYNSLSPNKPVPVCEVLPVSTPNTVLNVESIPSTKTDTKNVPWLLSGVHKSWLPILKDALDSNPGLEKFVSDTRDNNHVYPKPEHVFNAFKLGIDDIKVVILGQDPYHGPGQAFGLSFAVPDGISSPPSLKNIMKEVRKDFGYEDDVRISLNSWANQGVFLLNTILTVECGKPLSHAGAGWEQVTDAVLKELVSRRKGIVFMLWGKTAQKKIPLLGSGQTILEAAHPSPLSAHHGYFGCKHFSKANQALGNGAIKWVEDK
jgi:uracil-DNA glycosylase